MLMVFRRKKRKAAPPFSVRKWDPLFIIFEKHLYDFNYESRELFIGGVVKDYLSHLMRQKAMVPPAWKGHLEKTLTDEVSDMLVRKLYGCLTVEEFKQKAEKPESKDELVTARKEVRKRYQKLAG
ncbi:MAG: hypothetical protein AB7K68_12015 [Bacteriovoracia bacterium]